MSFTAFNAHVVSSQRLSPSFQRIRLGGLKQMGPAGPVRDLRIKLIFPGRAGLPTFPPGNWYEHWVTLDPTTRGDMRTYSIRNAYPERGEIDVDFVLHTAPGATGPASAWAASARAGDEIVVCGPARDDASGVGIEFAPGSASQIHLFGDETALPAIARIVDEWPTTPLGPTGTVHVEVPYPQDQQILAAPNGVQVRYYPRQGHAHGAALLDAAASLLSTSVPEREEAEGDMTWETPAFSALGEEISGELDTPHGDAYYWIAGESSLVTTMRRMLVKQAGIPRSNVSFMGYWRQGRAGS